MRATAVAIRHRREPGREPRETPGLAAPRSVERESFQEAQRPAGPDRRRGESRLALAVVLATVVALGAAEWRWSWSPSPTTAWQTDLDRFALALADKDLDAAAEAWAHAYRSAMGADGDWRGPVAIAEAWQQLVRRAGSNAPEVSGVRKLYLTALTRAVEAEDMDGVIVIGNALGDLGDLDGVERVLRIARRLATATPGDGLRAELETLESRLTVAQHQPDADRPVR
jgi:hypothetical protein